MGDVLVIGATGKVGSNLVETLAKQGVSVRAATRQPAKAKFPAGVTGVEFDFADPSTFEGAIGAADRLFIIAPPGTPADGLASFLALALPKMERVVTMTSAGAETDETGAHRAFEKKIEAGAKAWTHVRPGWFMQNFHTSLLPNIKSVGKIRLPAGDGKIAFIDARDIADCAAAALTRDGFTGKAIVVTGGEALSYGEAAEILSRETGVSIGYEHVDDEAYRQELVSKGVAPAMAATLVALNVRIRTGGAARVSQGVQTFLGRAPRTLADYARTYRASFA